MLERPSRREKKPARAKAANALAAMAELRKTGKRQADTYEVKEEDDVYDMVDEEQYERLVSKRQKEVGQYLDNSSNNSAQFPQTVDNASSVSL